MPKRVKKPATKRALSKDVNQHAHALVEMSTRKRSAPPTPDFKEQLSAYMRKLGQKGGKKSGKTRREWLPEERRIEIASIAAKARWAKQRKKEEVG